MTEGQSRQESGFDQEDRRNYSHRDQRKLFPAGKFGRPREKSTGKGGGGWLRFGWQGGWKGDRSGFHQVKGRAISGGAER